MQFSKTQLFMIHNYLVTIKLNNGDEINARAVGEDTSDALVRLLSVEQVKDFVNEGKGISSLELKENFVKDVEPQYKLEKSKFARTGWVLTDLSNMIVIRWLEGHFNESVKITSLTDEEVEPLKRATVLRQAGEWLFNNHKELI